MSLIGVDYSWARPGGAALAKAGVSAAGRYLASDRRGITVAEYKDLTAHGIAVWLAYESSATGMLKGYGQGRSDATSSVQHIRDVGLSPTATVYATADFDVQTSQFAACDDYLRGFASVLGVSRVGIYGGLHYLNHACQMGLAVKFWRCGSTSFDHHETAQMTIHLHQTTNTPPVPGTDFNYILDSSFAGDNVTPIIARKGPTMSTLYYTTTATAGTALYGLAGDGVGAAAWLETSDPTLANALAGAHHISGQAVFLTPDSYAVWKSAYLGSAPTVISNLP